MHKQELQQILHDLKVERDTNEQLDSHQVDTLSALIEELERQVQDPSNDMNAALYLVERLKEPTEEFKVKHPQLTSIIGRFSNLLSAIGI
ncbi:DUF4404 family protein [Aliikangiella sp. IMCC44653]